MRPWHSAALAALLFWASPAAAQPDVNRARELAQGAAELLDKKSWSEALAQAEKAEALYHAPFHVFIIAQALEGLGRLAEATAAYEKLASEPLPPSASPVFKESQAEGKKRLNALLARVPSILVRVDGPAKDSAKATVDGKAFDLAAGVATRVDPGEHAVVVTADGFRTAERKVTTKEKGGVEVVAVALTREGDPEPAAPTESAPATSASPAPDAPRPSRVPAFVAFGIGAAGLGVGAVTGILFLGKLGDLKDRCPNDRCSPADQADIDSTGTLGTISTIGFGVGAAGVVAGIVLLAVRPSAKASTTAALARRATPTLGPGSAGVRWSF